MEWVSDTEEEVKHMNLVDVETKSFARRSKDKETQKCMKFFKPGFMIPVTLQCVLY